MEQNLNIGRKCAGVIFKADKKNCKCWANRCNCIYLHYFRVTLDSLNFFNHSKIYRVLQKTNYDIEPWEKSLTILSPQHSTRRRDPKSLSSH